MQYQKPLQEDLLIALEETIRNLKFTFNNLFSDKDFDISYDQWLVLSQIWSEQGISQQAIAKNTVKEPASVSRIIRTLQRKDLVMKISDQENKRANKLYLTHKGYDLSEKVMKVYLENFQDQFKGIYERELNYIRDVLSRIGANRVRSTV